LEEAPGIGPKRRQALLESFGSFDAVKDAKVEDITKVEGMTQKSAESLRKWLDEYG